MFESVTGEPQRVFRVGCPMWAHRPWVGRWYPRRTKPGTELALYSKLCNSVEGNTTFYAEPSADSVRRWAEQTSSEFRFAFKVPRTITHERRLNDVAKPVRSFLNAIEPLGDRIGPVQVQLSPAFGPDGLAPLLSFVRRLPQDWPWAIELRHPGWFDESTAHRTLDDELNARGIGRVVLDTRPLYAAPARTDAAVDEKQNKPNLPISLGVVGPHPLIRVIGEDSATGTADGLKRWVPQLAEWIAEGREPFVFVHQPENLDSPGLARDLHQVVREHIGDLAALPEAPVVDEPEQTSIF